MVTVYDWGQHDFKPGENVRQRWVEIVFSAMVKLGVVGGMLSVVPAKSRWGTCNKALGGQSLSVLCFRVGPRSLRKAFPKWEDKEPSHIEDETEDFHKVVRSKIWRSLL